MTPAAMGWLISEIRGIVKVPLAVHCHNDFGMAAANTITAVMSGATIPHVTVNGLGERAGNAPLEEVVLGLKHLHGRATGVDLSRFASLSHLVETASGHPVAWQKSLVGAGAFTHEAGIHVDGLLKDPRNYQGVDPAELGRGHRLVLGKHSGRGAVRRAYADLLHLDLDLEQAGRVLPLVRRFVTLAKRPPRSGDMIGFLRDIGHPGLATTLQ
jgi:homocitrate synthase NifV